MLPAYALAIEVVGGVAQERAAGLASIYNAAKASAAMCAPSSRTPGPGRSATPRSPAVWLDTRRGLRVERGQIEDEIRRAERRRAQWAQAQALTVGHPHEPFSAAVQTAVGSDTFQPFTVRAEAGAAVRKVVHDYQSAAAFQRQRLRGVVARSRGLDLAETASTPDDTTLAEILYHAQLFDRDRIPVVSLAVLGDEDMTWRPDRFGYTLWGCELSLRFPTVKLRDLDPAMLERLPNPLAVLALLHRDAQETRRPPEERLQASESATG